MSLSINYSDNQSERESLSSADTKKKEKNDEENHGYCYKMQDCLFSCLLCRFGFYELE